MTAVAHAPMRRGFSTAVRELARLYSRERVLFVLGLTGVLLAAVCGVLMAVRGRYIPPEGDLLKPASFDFALGIYVLTLALYVPFAGFTRAGRRWWVGWTIAIVVYGYTIETIQQLRGVDPRFSDVATPLEQIAGLVFFLLAVGLIPLYAVLAAKLRARRGSQAARLLLVSVGYASVSVVLGFGAGIWMSAQGGSRFGASDILPIHALGFHGLQAIPLVAVPLVWAGAPAERAARLIHAAGIAWLTACAAVLAQTLSGRPVVEASILPAVAAVLLFAWAVILVTAIATWRSSGWRVPEVADAIPDVHVSAALPLRAVANR